MRICGLSKVLPGDPVPTDELAAQHGWDGELLSKRPGVLFRHYTKEDQISMGATALSAALSDAGLVIDDLDMIISASAVPYQPIPSMSSILLSRFDVEPGRVETMDVNTTCLSFLTAFDLASMMIEAGRALRIAIVSSECASRGLPWHDDPECAAHFGDGAAACIVSSGGDRIVSSKFRTYSNWESCQLKSGGTRYSYDRDKEDFEAGRFFRMNGPDLFKLTFAHLPKFIDEVLAKAGWEKSDIDCVVPHQASPLAIRHMSRALGFSCPVIDIAKDVGNQIAASIPTALFEARARGHMKSGSKLLILGTSAGVSFGAVALEMA